MVKPLPLSAFIISLNEAKRIGQTLQSLQGLASEIIVIDSGSTDGTQEVAASYGATVIHNDWPGYGQQKRFAEEQCTHSWVLNLDADEVLSAELIQEIRQLFSPACTTDITHPACGGGRGGATCHSADVSTAPPSDRYAISFPPASGGDRPPIS